MSGVRFRACGRESAGNLQREQHCPGCFASLRMMVRHDEQQQTQIPFGNDNQNGNYKNNGKNKNNGNSISGKGAMEFKEGLKLALQSLWANKLRSVLTLLGVVIGVASVIAVVTLVNGANTYIETKFSSYGADVFTVSRMPQFITSSEDYVRSSRDGRTSCWTTIATSSRTVNTASASGRSRRRWPRSCMGRCL